MRKTGIEIAVGIFVLLGFACIGYMTVELGDRGVGKGGTYRLIAKFDSVSGLKMWAHVEIAGIRVGRVSNLTLDPELQLAVVELTLRDDVEVGDDVIASVKTSGLIGDKFVKLTPGGSPDILSDGETITETESTLDLEALVGKYVFGDVQK